MTEVDDKLRLIVAHIAAGKLHYRLLRRHVHVLGQHRRQPGDAQRLMSLSQRDAVPLIDVIDGEQLYIHLLQTGHHTVGNVKLLQRHRLPPYFLPGE